MKLKSKLLVVATFVVLAICTLANDRKSACQLMIYV